MQDKRPAPASRNTDFTYLRYERPERFNLMKELVAWLETFVISIIVVALIITFVGRMMQVEGISMMPTLQNGERLITTPLYTGLQHGDIVVIRRKGDKPIIKRIIGVPGDTVDIDFVTHVVTLNGKVLEEPYINEPTQRSFDVEFPVTVPEDHYFVMGDNRNHSDDSRHSEIGMIDRRNIFGKAVYRIWPVSQLGKIDPVEYTY